MVQTTKPNTSTISERQRKDTNKIISLRKYIEITPTIDVIEHVQICKDFGLPYCPEIFRQVYDQRFLASITDTPLTAATIAKLTGLKHKYICHLKRRFERAKIITVSHMGKCPTTGSNNVQFLTIKPNHD